MFRVTVTNYVRYSYERRSQAITTNVDFSRWGSVLSNGQMAAIISKVAHHGRFIVFEGEGCRLRHVLIRA